VNLNDFKQSVNNLMYTAANKIQTMTADTYETVSTITACLKAQLFSSIHNEVGFKSVSSWGKSCQREVPL